MVAFCCVVAVFTIMIWTGSSYPRQLVHSLSIGMVTWSTIEFGRLLFATEHCHLASDGTRGWPKGWRGIVLTAAGIAAGFFVGTWVARTLLGEGAYFAPELGNVMKRWGVADDPVAAAEEPREGRRGRRCAARPS